jgi:hypothetical protein
MKHVPPIADLSPLTFRLAHSLLLSRFLSPAAPCLDVNARGLSEWTAALKEPPDSAIERFQAGEPVLVQPEMEKERSPLVSIPPCGRGFSRYQGLSIRWVSKAAQETDSHAADHRLDEPTRLSLSMVASLQCPLPFHPASHCSSLGKDWRTNLIRWALL